MEQDRLPWQDPEAPLPFDEENGVGSIRDVDDVADWHAERPLLGCKLLDASVLCHWGASHLSTPRELLYSLQHLRI